MIRYVLCYNTIVGCYGPGDSNDKYQGNNNSISITADLSYTMSLSSGGEKTIRCDDGLSTSPALALSPAQVYQLAPISQHVEEEEEEEERLCSAMSHSGITTTTATSGWDSVCAYCPQIPCMLDGSVRSNILMGHELIPSLYEDVLAGCGLRQDMMVWYGMVKRVFSSSCCC